MSTKPIALTLLATIGLAALLISCSEERQQARGFVLPEGDIEAGQVAFAALKCTQCHPVAGVEFNGLAPGTGVTLGGEVRKVKTYGELVTAVMDPQHTVSPQYTATHPTAEGQDPSSPMPNYSADMTVQQLQDIVAFLHSRYRQSGPDFPDYPLMMP